MLSSHTKNSRLVGHEETFIQMSHLLIFFQNDKVMNHEMTKVRGNDVCKMLKLFSDLASTMRNSFIKEIDSLKADLNTCSASSSKTNPQASLNSHL